MPTAADIAAAHPVLSLEAARRFEAALFGGDEAREWEAMRQAGRAIAAAVLRDFDEIGPLPPEPRILVLAGKGHNGGDALLAAKFIHEKHPRARIEVCLVFGERVLRPLALRAWRELSHAPPCRARPCVAPRLADGENSRPDARSGPANVLPGPPFDIVLDGIFGFQFRPPVEPRVAALIARVNALPACLRAAVDLPSGLGTPDVFQADFTYATGIVKSPALAEENRAAVGRLRYLDLGFWDNTANPSPVPADPPAVAVLTPAVLSPLRHLRPPLTDKRDYGHLFIVGGSRGYPGAVIMAALAALRSGAGLVTVFVPETMAAACAARAPEAMWVAWPETPDGGLALEGAHLFRERAARATALLVGPGLGREAETLALAADLANLSAVPLVLDADALQPAIVGAGAAPRILTPHAGEFARIASVLPGAGAVTVLKGPVTRIDDGGATMHHSLFGGPVLARGGSGDLLAGLIGGLLAQEPAQPRLAACRGAVWHGLAADRLARAQGQRAVNITQLLDHLAGVLREDVPAAAGKVTSGR